MSTFNTCILVTRDGSSLEQLANKASTELAKFDINKDMEPYKLYVGTDEIKRMAESYGIDLADLSALAEKLEEWNGDNGGVDDRGFYGISKKNLDGHIDRWSILTEVKPEDRGRLLFGQGGEEKTVKAFVAPDGKWIDGPCVYSAPNAEQERELKAWDKKLATLLDEHKDAVAFLAECHI